MQIVNFIRWGWQQILPAPCLWCSLPVNDHQRLLCSACQQALPRFPYQLCHYNLLWLPAVRSGLENCEFTQLLSIGWYELPYQRWIRQWKFHHDMYAAELLKQLFVDTLYAYRQSGQTMPEGIVYVPMSPKKERKRGFNQAKLLAQCAAAELNIPLLDVIHRVKETPSQVGLTRLQRQQNLAGAFEIISTVPLPTHLVLIDDVVTTGTTANLLARLLKQHGVTSLSLWTLAVTPNADHSSA